MEPQTEIRIIELARERTKDLTSNSRSQDTIIDNRYAWFDKAYKAIKKTVGSEQETTISINFATMSSMFWASSLILQLVFSSLAISTAEE